jgi:hypothetical protein
MPVTTTDRYIEKQLRIERGKEIVRAGYSTLWQKMVSEWQSPEENDRSWLLYSANYLFHTGGVRWALDPLTLRQRLPSAPEVDVAVLAALDYVVLTHRHADHLDLRMLGILRDFSARWVVPEFLLDSLRALDLPLEKVIIPHPLKPLLLGGLTLIPFDGLHWEDAPGFPDERRGVPATGYLAEFNDKRWLFPGDTRNYVAARLPRLGPVDGLVAHLWLGRGCALQDELPLVDPFCRFCVDLSPRRLVITHLNEFGRSADDLWDDQHAEIIIRKLREMTPRMEVSVARMGDSILL